MARIRTIKPSFFTSLTITDLTYEQRLTFIGLWTHVDDEGRCEYDPRLLKAAVWPLDERNAADVDRDVHALTNARLVTRYTVNSRSYLSVNGWHEHQRINRARESEYPAPESGEIAPLTCGNTGFSEPSVNPHGGLTEGSLPERKGREGKRERNGVARTRAAQLPDDWHPNEKHNELATELRVDITTEAAKFTDYCHANGKTYKDHDRAFNNWLRNAQQFAGRPTRQQEVDGVYQRAMARARGEQQ